MKVRNLRFLDFCEEYPNAHARKPATAPHCEAIIDVCKLFILNIKQIYQMTLGDPKSEEMEPWGEQKGTKGYQKGAKR